jgi:hypothetical protein
MSGEAQERGIQVGQGKGRGQHGREMGERGGRERGKEIC